MALASCGLVPGPQVWTTSLDWCRISGSTAGHWIPGEPLSLELFHFGVQWRKSCSAKCTLLGRLEQGRALHSHMCNVQTAGTKRAIVYEMCILWCLLLGNGTVVLLLPHIHCLQMGIKDRFVEAAVGVEIYWIFSGPPFQMHGAELSC